MKVITQYSQVGNVSFYFYSYIGSRKEGGARDEAPVFTVTP